MEGSQHPSPNVVVVVFVDLPFFLVYFSCALP